MLTNLSNEDLSLEREDLDADAFCQPSRLRMQMRWRGINRVFNPYP